MEQERPTLPKIDLSHSVDIVEVTTAQLEADRKALQDAGAKLAHETGQAPRREAVIEAWALGAGLDKDEAARRAAAVEAAFPKTAPQEPKFATVPLPEGMKEPDWWPRFPVGRQFPLDGVWFSIHEVSPSGILCVPVRFNAKKKLRRLEKKRRRNGRR